MANVHSTLGRRGLRRSEALLFFLILFITSCSTATLLKNLAVDASKRFILGTAQGNYQTDYTNTLERLLDHFIAPVDEAGSLAIIAAGSVTPGPDAVEAVADAELPEVVEPDPVELDPLELEVSVYRELLVNGRPVPVPVEDGDVVSDGVGRPGDGDNLKIQFSASASAYVYAVWIDATGWATPIFPRGARYTHVNPVVPGEEITVPGGSDWFYLDDFRGVENLYFVASRGPLVELEELLDGLVGKEREFRSDVKKPLTVEGPELISRGLKGIRPGKAKGVMTSDGAAHEAPTQVFIGALAGGDLVVTRWFRHE